MEETLWKLLKKFKTYECFFNAKKKAAKTSIECLLSNPFIGITILTPMTSLSENVFYNSFFEHHKFNQKMLSIFKNNFPVDFYTTFCYFKINLSEAEYIFS